MTSREFKIWLDGFLTNTNLSDVKVSEGFGNDYNYMTMLKTILDKLKTVIDYGERSNINHITERIVPTTPPNPFTITCEKINDEESNSH